MRKEDSVAWLREFLGSDVKSTLAVRSSARDAGLSIDGLKLARALLGVASFRKEPMGSFFMCLPEVDHEDYFKTNTNCGSDPFTDEQRAVTLVKDWRASRVGSSAALPGLVEQVEWVAEVVLLPMSLLKVSDVPCGGAMSLLLYAKDDPVGFRQIYHAKLMPTRGSDFGPRKKSSRVKVSSGADGRDAIDRLLGKKSGGEVGDVPLEAESKAGQ